MAATERGSAQAAHVAATSSMAAATALSTIFACSRRMLIRACASCTAVRCARACLQHKGALDLKKLERRADVARREKDAEFVRGRMLLGIQHDELLDEAQNAYYYFDTAKGESQWQRPEDFDGVDIAPSGSEGQGAGADATQGSGPNS